VFSQHPAFQQRFVSVLGCASPSATPPSVVRRNKSNILCVVGHRVWFFLGATCTCTCPRCLALEQGRSSNIGLQATCPCCRCSGLFSELRSTFIQRPAQHPWARVNLAHQVSLRRPTTGRCASASDSASECRRQRRRLASLPASDQRPRFFCCRSLGTPIALVLLLGSSVL
jgi:hypothetical protein